MDEYYPQYRRSASPVFVMRHEHIHGAYHAKPYKIWTKHQSGRKIGPMGSLKRAGLQETNIPGFPVRRGKVRDTYDLGDDTLLMVSTDRISTFDAVHPTPIPDKGKILTAMTIFWLEHLRKRLPWLSDHLITTDVDAMGHGLGRSKDKLEGRSMLVRKAEVIPMECIARGYVAGSGWKEYKVQGTIGGHVLPSGLSEAAKLPLPLFTPSTKAETGHDVNITHREGADLVGADTFWRLERMTLEVYREAAAWADGCGIILADTKLEWGTRNGEIILVDEALTPDSSRYWPKDTYRTGRSPASFDKQYVRDHVEGLGWNKLPPAPALPTEVIEGTRERYIQAFEQLTGTRWEES